MSLSYWRCAFEGDCGTSFIPLVPSLWGKTFCHMPVREVWSLKRSRGVRWTSKPMGQNCCSSLYVDMGDCYSNLNLTSTKSKLDAKVWGLCVSAPHFFAGLSYFWLCLCPFLTLFPECSFSTWEPVSSTHLYHVTAPPCHICLIHAAFLHFLELRWHFDTLHLLLFFFSRL